MVNLSRHNEIDGVAPESAHPLLCSLARVPSLGINLFTERDASLLDTITNTVGTNLVALRLRACNFSAPAMLHCLSRASRLETLSVMAWNRQGDLPSLDSLFMRLPPTALPAICSLDLDENSVTDCGLAALACHRLASQLTALDCLDIHAASPGTFVLSTHARGCARTLVRAPLHAPTDSYARRVVGPTGACSVKGSTPALGGVPRQSLAHCVAAAWGRGNRARES